MKDKMTKDPKFRCCNCDKVISLLETCTIAERGYFDESFGDVHPTKKYCEECFEKITKHKTTSSDINEETISNREEKID